MHLAGCIRLTDNWTEKTATKCKTKNDKVDGQMDRSNDEQCKTGISGSECFSENIKRQIKRKKQRALRNGRKYENSLFLFCINTSMYISIYTLCLWCRKSKILKVSVD